MHDLQTQQRLKVALEEKRSALKKKKEATADVEKQIDAVENKIKALKKDKKSLTTQINDIEDVIDKENKKADPEAVKKLLDFVKSKGADREITVNYLRAHFADVESDINTLLNSVDRAKWQSVMNLAYSQASDEDKAELALLFQHFGVDKDLNRPLQEYTEREREVIQSVKADLHILQTEILTMQKYSLNEKNNIQKNQEKATEILRKPKELGRQTIDQIYKYLASKDVNMDLRLSDSDKHLMQGFVDFVAQVTNHKETKVKQDTPIEITILNYITKDPKQALYNTDQEWINALKGE